MKKYRLSALLGVGLLKDARLAAIAIVGALLLGGSAANAAVMNFDGSNGVERVGYWEENNFLFNPAGSQSSNLCYDSFCLHEVSNGVLTTMTYDTPGTADGDTSDAHLGPDKTNAQLDAVYNNVFNLDFFYFVLIGEGTDNEFTVTGYKDGGGTVSATVNLGDALGLVDPVATAGAKTSLAKIPPGNKCKEPYSVIDKNCGYWMDLDDAWNNLTSVTWTPDDTAQMHLDCVGANESAGRADSGCDPSVVPPSVVPEPATLALLGFGLLGLGFCRRKLRT
jgi:hypothetical protein